MREVRKNRLRKREKRRGKGNNHTGLKKIYIYIKGKKKREWSPCERDGREGFLFFLRGEVGFFRERFKLPFEEKSV